MARTYPMAQKRFSIYRRNQTTTVGANIVPLAPTSQAAISTGESILLKDLQGIIDNERGGTLFIGAYVGITFTDTVIIIGDIIADETENDRFGNPVEYEVQGKTIGIINTKLHLKRQDIGM